jgi:hypothetical protein
MLMNAGNFPIIALTAFVAVAVSAPAISYVFLKKERDSIAGSSNRKPLAPIFFTEVLLWLAATLVVGFVLVLLLGLFVYVNAHAGATGGEPVPVAPVLVVFGMLAVLSLYGVWLHAHSVGKLWRSL